MFATARSNRPRAWAALSLAVAATAAAQARDGGGPVVLLPDAPVVVESKGPYVLATGSFSVVMPHKPTEERSVAPTAHGEIVMQRYRCATATEEFTVSYSQFPEPLGKGTSPDKMLVRGRDNAIANLHGQLLSERDLRLGHYPGKEFRVAADPDAELTMRTYLVGSRIYALAVAYRRGHPPAELDRFFRSFQVETP